MRPINRNISQLKRELKRIHIGPLSLQFIDYGAFSFSYISPTALNSLIANLHGALLFQDSGEDLLKTINLIRNKEGLYGLTDTEISVEEMVDAHNVVIHLFNVSSDKRRL